MRATIVAILIFTASASAAAALTMSRYDTRQLSCNRIQAILKSEGTAVLRYPSPRNPGNIIYDTYSAKSGKCKTGGFGKRATVPAANTKSCKVFRCVRRQGGR
jgi:hypothetical protein